MKKIVTEQNSTARAKQLAYIDSFEVEQSLCIERSSKTVTNGAAKLP